jgi:endonuclease/exonuclease/phosphatase (EEP) superfamily protein YafD
MTMRGPLDPEQLLSPELLKSANTLLSVCLVVIAGLGVLASLGALFTLDIGDAIVKLAGAITLPLTIWLIVRLLSEILMAQQAINERLTLLNENVIATEYEVTPEANHSATADKPAEAETTKEAPTPAPATADDTPEIESVEDAVENAISKKDSSDNA